MISCVHETACLSFLIILMAELLNTPDGNHSLQVVMTEVGFSHDRPVAACVIFKSLLHWHSFEAERTNVFDRIIQNMGQAIDGNQENNEILAYWLSNTATLLSLLQRTLKASASSGATKKKQLNVSLMGRLTQVRQCWLIAF
jgi:myosin-5